MFIPDNVFKKYHERIIEILYLFHLCLVSVRFDGIAHTCNSVLIPACNSSFYSPFAYLFPSTLTISGLKEL